MTDQAILETQQCATNRCACGNLKWPNRHLCKTCWYALPLDERAVMAKAADETRKVMEENDPHPAAKVLHQVALSEEQMDRIYLGAPFEQKRAAIQGLLRWDREHR